MKTEFENLGEWLRHWRKQFGFTQTALGLAVGVSKQHISNLERRQQHGTSGAESNASIELLDKLSHLFKRPIKEARILAGYEPRNHVATVEQALDASLYWDLKGLGEAEKEALRPILEMLDREAERLAKLPKRKGPRQIVDITEVEPDAEPVDKRRHRN